MNLCRFSPIVALAFALSSVACNKKPNPKLPPDIPIAQHEKSGDKASKGGGGKGKKKGKKGGKGKEAATPAAATPKAR